MSVTFDSIVKNAMANRDKNLSDIEGLKKLLTPCTPKKVLKEHFDRIIEKDPDYIRRYLKSASNIAYQKDVYIDGVNVTKEKLTYRNTLAGDYERVFNNDSVYLNFGNGDKILIVCNDPSLASDNYNYYSDVYVNGIKLNKKEYFEVLSNQHKEELKLKRDFNTGARRYFINEDKIEGTGDIISIVIRKEPKCDSFYKAIYIEDANKKSYVIKKEDLGRYGEILDPNEDVSVLENLLVFKKSSLEIDTPYFQLDTKAYVKEYIPFTYNFLNDGIKTIGNKSDRPDADINVLPTEDVEEGTAYRVLTSGTYGKYTCKPDDVLYAIETKETSDDENWGYIPSSERSLLVLDLHDDDVNSNDVYLIVNRTKHIECETTISTTLTDEEFIKYEANKLISLDLVDKSISVDGCKLPLPVKSIDDVEVFVDGYRLINNVDFTFINNEKCAQYIKFNGILKPKSVVVFRNKNIDNTHNFYYKKDKLEKYPNFTSSNPDNTVFNSNYIAFTPKLRNYISNDTISNNTEVLILGKYDYSNSGIECILHKKEYGNDFSHFYKIVKDTEDARKAIDANSDLGIYNNNIATEESDVDCILVDEEFINQNKKYFELVNDEKYIAFTPAVQKLVESGRIVLEGIKVFDGVMYTRYSDEEYKDILENLSTLGDSDSIATTFSYGIIDLDNLTQMPIGEDYIEAYLGRVRVPLCNKRSIINRYLKIDNQNTALTNLEVYSEVEWTDYAKTIANMFKATTESVQNIYNQLDDIDVDGKIIDNWLTLNDDKLNTDKDINEEDDDIFYGRFNRISISTTNTSDQKMIKQNVYPIFRVLGYYNETDYIDITNVCDYKFENEDGEEIPDFNTTLLGKQRVTAIFQQGELGDLNSDEIILEVIAEELQSIKVISTNNIFTIGDDILDGIRVIGYYESGREMDVTDKCTIEITDYSGNEYNSENITEGSYIVTAYYTGLPKDSETILVYSASERKIKALDITHNSIVQNKEIVTMLDIYATYNNDLVQKISDANTVEVDVYYKNVKIGGPYNPLNIPGLERYKDYTLRIRVYNDAKKETIIETPSVDNHIDVNIRLFNNNLELDNKVLYYDGINAKLDSDFVNMYKSNPDYYYYSIKNLNAGKYLSIGRNTLKDNEEIMIIGDTEEDDNSVVIVEFYDENTKSFKHQVPFILKYTNKIATSNGLLTGNIMEGYTIAINKFDLQADYSKPEFINSAILRDSEGNIIVKYNSLIPKTENFYVDTVATDSSLEFLYINFDNFKTSSGNVKDINNYIEKSKEEGKILLDLFFEIESINTVIELHVPEKEGEEEYTSEFDYFDYEMLDAASVTIESSSDEQFLVIEPALDEDLIAIRELRPGNHLATERSIDSSEIKFELNYDVDDKFATTLTSQKIGLYRYCYKTNLNKIYVIEVNIINKDGIGIIDTLNGKEIELTQIEE